MRKSIEKRHIDITIGMLIFIIVTVVSGAFFVGQKLAQFEGEHKEFDDRITHVGEKVVIMRAELGDLVESGNNRDIELAKINTKLANIETLLIEIKQDLRTHDQ